MDFSDKALLEFSRALVRTPSLPGEEGAAADLVARQLRAFGFSPQVDAYGSIIAMLQGAPPGPTLLFDAHLDVVPAGDPATWLHPPFGGEVANGRLYGRGAADTKGSLAAMIWALARARRSEERIFFGQVIFAASVCEENLTGAAVGALLDRRPADLLVTGEPTSLRVGIAQKGRATLVLHAAGRSAHTSTPWAGDNAVYKMLTAVQRLRSIYPTPVAPELSNLTTPQPTNGATLSPLGPTILELTEVISEPFPNGLSVPHGCRTRWIARLLPEETAAAFLGHVRLALADIPGITAELGTLEQILYTGKKVIMEDFLPGWRTPPGSHWLEAVSTALRSTGLPAEPFYAPCGTNASAAAARGLPCLIYGPGRLEDAHTVDESLDIEELFAAARGFEAIVNQILVAQPVPRDTV